VECLALSHDGVDDRCKRNSRRGETRRDRLHESAAKRREADGRGDRENRSKTERTEAHAIANTALWTTVSGFESPPPSQTRKFHQFNKSIANRVIENQSRQCAGWPLCANRVRIVTALFGKPHARQARQQFVVYLTLVGLFSSA